MTRTPLLLVLMALGQPITAQPITNPDFETMDAWQIHSGPGAELDSSVARSGRHSLRLHGPGGIFQRVDVRGLEGSRIRFSVHVRSPDASVSVYAQPFNGCKIPPLPPVQGRDGWGEHTIEFMVTGTSEEVVVGVNLDGEGPAWIDGAAWSATPHVSLPLPKGDALAFLEGAIDVMEEHSLRRDSIDWDAFRSSVRDEGRGAELPCEAVDALRFAVASLGDGHSFLIDEAWSRRPRDVTPRVEEDRAFGITAELSGASVGYLLVPGVQTGDSATMVAYAEALQAQIEALSARAVCGWIIDLRQNPGGNMWPMIAGLGPLLGDGTIGFFSGPGVGWEEWSSAAGASSLKGTPIVQVGKHVVSPDLDDAPIAVLLGNRTGSSGEATAIAFQGRPRTRSFGEPTAGQTTGNTTFELGEGWLLALTTRVMADRNRRIYRGPIPPDEPVAGNSEAVVEAAGAWLLNQHRCR
jgi:hypothetical protein